MIYLDTSVALAELFMESRRPPAALWREPLVSSRLLEYELWNRLNVSGRAASHGRSAEALIQQIALLELAPNLLSRALAPYPSPVRALDALHLASMCFLREQGQMVQVAAYDDRIAGAARELGFSLYVG